MERWMLLEDRNERLFEILGWVGSHYHNQPDIKYPIGEVLDLLYEIAYGEVETCPERKRMQEK